MHAHAWFFLAKPNTSIVNTFNYSDVFFSNSGVITWFQYRDQIINPHLQQSFLTQQVSEATEISIDQRRLDTIHCSFSSFLDSLYFYNLDLGSSRTFKLNYHVIKLPIVCSI